MMCRKLVLVFALAAAVPAFAQLRISQVYGGGGNSGATYKNDFIELFNAGSAPVSLAGYSVQYAASAGTSWAVTALAGTLAPGHYYLVQEAAGAGGTVNLPTPDAPGSIAMSGTSGKVALVSSTTALTGSGCPIAAPIVDFVGYGSSANCSETAPTANLSNTTAAIRRDSGYADSGNNSADFTVAAPIPRNSAVNAWNATLTGAPNPVASGSATTFTFSAAGLASASCDLTSISGSAAFPLTVTAAAAAASYTVPSSVLSKTYPLTCTAVNLFTHTVQLDVSLQVTSSSIPPSAVGSASPNPVTQGQSVHLDALITAGANPASSSTSAACDLTPIGGAPSVALPADYTVPLTTGAGPYGLACSVTDDLYRSSPFTLSLTVQVPPPTFYTIAQINGPGTSSPLAGTRVLTRGVVTALRGNTGGSKGFYLESLPADRDSDPNTSEGILVYVGSAALPACAAAGNSVQLEASVQDYVPGAAPVGSFPLTELSSTANCTVLGTVDLATLPAPVTLTTANLAAGGPATQARKFLGMRVVLPSAIAVAPSLGSLTEKTATATAGSVFFVSLPGVPRPFRSAGIIDTRRPSDAGSNVPHYNANPEALRVDANGLTGGTTVQIATGDPLGAISGIMEYDTADGIFQLYTNAAGIASRPAAPTLSATPVPAPLATDLTIANFNTQHFYNDLNDDNGNSASATILTTAAYQGRLNKLSLAVRNVLRLPDILTFEEFEGPRLGSGTQTFPVPQDVVNKLNADASAAGQGAPNYDWCEFATNDPSWISIAVVYKRSKVTLAGCTQFGGATTFTKPLLPHNQSTLNDRPPVVFLADVLAPGSDSPLRVRVVANHIRSLSDLDAPGDTGDFPRTKRNEQALYLARLLSGNLPTEQTDNWNATDNLIVTGDFNAYQFNDGYVDVLGCVAAAPSAPDAQYFTAAQLAVTAPCGTVFTPALTNLTTTDAAQRYSYTFSGAAQRIDHILVNTRMLPRVRQFAYARNNADFPEGPTYRNDTTRPERVSDHDMPMVYLKLPVEVTSRTRLNATAPFLNRATGRYNGTISVTNTGAAALAGPIYVFFRNLPAGVTLPDLPQSDGVPYATINLPAGLAPGATSATVTISFADPSNVRIGYTSARFDGQF